MRCFLCYMQQISIHALREEGDTGADQPCTYLGHFYPRPPRGGRRALPAPGVRSMRYFYPRPPRGGRLFGLRVSVSSMEFLSTPSARRATLSMGIVPGMCLFLSTPSARRATRNYVAPRLTELFLSTPSARRATRSHSQT